MKKLITALLLSLTLLTACDSNSFETQKYDYSASVKYETDASQSIFDELFKETEKNGNAENNKNNSTDSENTPAYLQLYFGNGEVYSTEIVGVAYVADTLSGYAVKRIGDNWPQSDIADIFSNKSYKVHGMTALFKTEEEYGFSDVKTASYDANTNTITLELWRDEPYTKEAEVFTKIK